MTELTKTHGRPTQRDKFTSNIMGLILLYSERYFQGNFAKKQWADPSTVYILRLSPGRIAPRITIVINYIGVEISVKLKRWIILEYKNYGNAQYFIILRMSACKIASRKLCLKWLKGRCHYLTMWVILSKTQTL